MFRLGDGWLYARKSAYRGRLKDRGRSVDEQLTEGRDWCDDNEVHVAGEWVDDDRSASPMAEEVPREAFDEMVAAIESGVVKRGDVVITWEASRLYRDLDVYVKLRKVCANAGVYLCINGELFDLTKRSDRRRSASDAVDAEDRAWEISEQVQRSLRANARQGRPHGRHQYGFTRIYDSRTGDLVKVIANETEAAVVEELFDRVYAHESEWSIMQDFNDRGIWSPSGKACHRDIGVALAQLREDAGLTVADVAVAMRWKDRRVERIEAARWGIRLDELQMLCELYNAPETTSAALEKLWRTLPQWTNYAQVRQILTNKTYIGVRQYNDGKDEAKAIWPAIVKPEIFHAVNLMMRDPARRSARATADLVHLLTALIECGKPGCGGESRPQWREPRSVMKLVPGRKARLPLDVRDAALLVVLEAAGGRCADVAAARVEDFDVDSGILRDVGGERRAVELNDWAARCVGRWLDVLDRTSGPLFRRVDESGVKDQPLTAEAIQAAVNTRRQRAGWRTLAPDEFPTVIDGSDLAYLTYACGRHHCFRARAVDVERYVVAQLVIRFARHDAAELFAVRDSGDDKTSELRAQIDRWQGDLAEAEQLVTAGKLSVSRLANLEALIGPKIKTAERQLQQAVANPLVERLLQPDAEAVYAEWRRLTLRQQRAVIRSELKIVIMPKGKGRRHKPPAEYVRLEWRRETASRP